VLEDDVELDWPDDEESVEYLLDEAVDSSVATSVPKSAQLSQTCSSALSTVTVFGEAAAAPHISH